MARSDNGEGAMRLQKPEIPTSKVVTWAPASGCDVNITVTAKDAVLWSKVNGKMGKKQQED